MATDFLFEQLKHPNPNLRERAMYDIAESCDEATIPRLMSILDEDDMVYRRAAVKALGVIGPDAVPPLAESLLNHEDATIRSSCAKALAQIAVNWSETPFPTEGMQALKMALDDPNPVVHIASVMALGELGMPGLDILTEALQTTDNIAVAIAIMNALGSKGDGRAVQVLSMLANDESADPYIRESAASALSRLDQVTGYRDVNR